MKARITQAIARLSEYWRICLPRDEECQRGADIENQYDI